MYRTMFVSLLMAGTMTVSMTSSTNAQESLRIGLFAPFSGDYAIYGEGYQRGIDVWKKMYGEPMVGDRAIEVVDVDTRCDVNTGMAAYRREIDKLVATIGPACSGVVKATMALADADKKPMLFLGHGATLTMGRKPGGYVFRMTQPDELDLQIFGDYLLNKWKKEGKTKVAVVHDTSVTYGNTGDVFKKEAEKVGGIDVVADEKFELGTTDFTSQILKIRQSGAEAMILVSYAADEGRFLQQASQLGLSIPVAGSTDTPYLATDKSQSSAETSKILNGVYFYSDYVQGKIRPKSRSSTKPSVRCLTCRLST